MLIYTLRGTKHPLNGSVARDSGGGGGGGSGTGVLSIEDEIRPHKKIGCKIDQIG